MFILDSLFLSGFRWVLDTVRTAADAELDDDTALREQLLAAEMRREMGEISDEAFAEIEAELLARIRDIKERREGGAGPIVFGDAEASGSQLAVEATVSGDFHEPADAELPPPETRDSRPTAPPRAARPARSSRSAPRRKIRKS